MRFDVALPADHFDLELCATSGQVFRWAVHPLGGWLGVDGDRWYRVTPLSKWLVLERGPEGEAMETPHFPPTSPAPPA